MVSSIVSPRDFEESTLLISLPSICAWMETSAWVCSIASGQENPLLAGHAWFPP